MAFFSVRFNVMQCALLPVYSECGTLKRMNAIITVVGSDKVGIIAKVSGFLAEHKVNIADISQTILSGNFVMMMMVDLDGADISIEDLRAEMNKTADAMGVEINIMSEKVFSAMHRI